MMNTVGDKLIASSVGSMIMVAPDMEMLMDVVNSLPAGPFKTRCLESIREIASTYRKVATDMGALMEEIVNDKTAFRNEKEE